MISKMRWPWLVVPFCLFSGDLAGQVVRGSDARAAMEALRERARPDRAVAVLTRRGGRLASAESLDAVADSLVGLALSYEGANDPQRRASLAAMGALVRSALPGDDEVPYPRAFEALVRIIDGEEAFIGIRGATLNALSELPQMGRVVGFLAEVAARENSSNLPSIAVRMLANDTGEAGLARLRRLFETDAVLDLTAKQRLASIAAHFGWGLLPA